MRRRGVGDPARVGAVLLPLLLQILPAPCLSASFVESFDGLRAWRADSILCSPAFDGRLGGSPGGGRAEQWVAGQFAESGLRPALEDGSFLQPFPVIGYRIAKASLELLDGPYGKVPCVEGVDWTALLTPAAGKVTAEAVLVGYGIDAPSKGRDDYGEVDLRGKIAVILRGRPADGQDWDEEYKRTHTFAAARAHGAAAVLYWQDGHAVAGAALAPECYDPKIPAAYISNRVLELLLRETGWTAEALKTKLASGPFPLPTRKRIRLALEVDGEKSGKAHNVIGMLRGSDPVLGTETVMIGAHLDHIGFDAHHHLYPGANDNASGAAVVLEMARAARESGWRPRRTVMFVAFGGEEMGLLGSKHLAAHLPFDSSRLVVMINLDMVGRGEGGTGIAGGNRVGQPYLAWRAGLDSVRAAGLEEYELSGESSDYAPFMDRGVRCLGCWSRGGYGRYHDIEDLPREISPDVLKSVGGTVASLLQAIADYPEAMRDDLGRERSIRAGSLQVGFLPIDAATLSDPDRSAVDGGGRISGRLVACDQGRVDTDEVLRRLGALCGLPGRHPWLHAAARLDQVVESRDKLECALLPFVSSAFLDRLGPDGARVLCAAGVAGATWMGHAAAPTRQTLATLADEGRLLVVDAGSGWREALKGQKAPHTVVRWGRASGAIPDPPDSTIGASALLVLSVDGVADSSSIRRAVDTWGEKRTHLDITSGLEAGVDDRESLRFIGWLRRQGWTVSGVEALLGGNLAGF